MRMQSPTFGFGPLTESIAEYADGNGWHLAFEGILHPAYPDDVDEDYMEFACRQFLLDARKWGYFIVLKKSITS